MRTPEHLAQWLYARSGGIFWAGETTWQDRHRAEAAQWFAYADQVAELEAHRSVVAELAEVCAEWDGLSKGSTATTRRIRSLLTRLSRCGTCWEPIRDDQPVVWTNRRSDAKRQRHHAFHTEVGGNG